MVSSRIRFLFFMLTIIHFAIMVHTNLYADLIGKCTKDLGIKPELMKEFNTNHLIMTGNHDLKCHAACFFTGLNVMTQNEKINVTELYNHHQHPRSDTEEYKTSVQSCVDRSNIYEGKCEIASKLLLCLAEI